MSKLIQIASQEIGTTEIEGSRSNPRILEYAKVAGFEGWYHNDDTPWCSVFLNWATEKAGLERSKSGRASSWQQVGRAIAKPEPGDLALFVPVPNASSVTHVGIYLGYSQDQTRIYVLGGNQSDQVNITAFPANTLAEFRRLAPVGPHAGISLPTPIRRGDRGTKVIALQDALKLAGFDVGTSDGDFGPRTEKAVQALQSQQGISEPTGVYDSETQTFLKSLLGQ